MNDALFCKRALHWRVPWFLGMEWSGTRCSAIERCEFCFFGLCKVLYPHSFTWSAEIWQSIFSILTTITYCSLLIVLHTLSSSTPIALPLSYSNPLSFLAPNPPPKTTLAPPPPFPQNIQTQTQTPPRQTQTNTASATKPQGVSLSRSAASGSAAAPWRSGHVSVLYKCVGGIKKAFRLVWFSAGIGLFEFVR